MVENLVCEENERLSSTCNSLQRYQVTQVYNTATSKISQEVLVAAPPVESEVEGTIATGSSLSRAASPDFLTIERSTIAFSTFTPNSSNTKELQNGTISLKLRPGEVILRDSKTPSNR